MQGVSIEVVQQRASVGWIVAVVKRQLLTGWHLDFAFGLAMKLRLALRINKIQLAERLAGREFNDTLFRNDGNHAFTRWR